MTHSREAQVGCSHQAVVLRNQRSKLLSTAVHHIDSWISRLARCLQSVFTQQLNVHISKELRRMETSDAQCEMKMSPQINLSWGEVIRKNYKAKT